jgi:heterodisulfide reductase subunit B
VRYAYYPGCSLERNAAAYDVSFRGVAEVLGIELVELEDWNCCGATEYFSLQLLPAYTLVARNLALVDSEFDRLVAPCSACYYNMHKTDKNMKQYPELREAVNEALAAGKLHYKPGRVQVRHVMEVITEDLSLDEITQHVKQPLRGLHLAPYYGCIPARPEGPYDPEHPEALDHLLAALGADVVDYPVKADCCGGHMTQISADTAYEMLRYLLHNAEKAGAEALVVACPMCQLNLDAYQGQVNSHFGTKYKIPILYLTQVIGLAFGLDPKDLGFGQEIVSADPLLEKLRHPPEEEEEEKPRRRRRRDDPSLPMPQPLSGGAS